MRVEKHSSSRGVKYAIGNIDEAKTKYKTEKELIDACLNKTQTP
jgi:ferritin